MEAVIILIIRNGEPGFRPSHVPDLAWTLWARLIAVSLRNYTFFNVFELSVLCPHSVCHFKGLTLNAKIFTVCAHQTAKFRE